MKHFLALAGFSFFFFSPWSCGSPLSGLHSPEASSTTTTKHQSAPPLVEENKGPILKGGSLKIGSLYSGIKTSSGNGILGLNTGQFVRAAAWTVNNRNPYSPNTVYARRNPKTNREEYVTTDANGMLTDDSPLKVGYRVKASQLGGQGDEEYVLVRAQNGAGYWVKSPTASDSLIAKAFPPGFFLRKPPATSAEDARYAWVKLAVNPKDNKSIAVTDADVAVVSVTQYQNQVPVGPSKTASQPPAAQTVTYSNPNQIQAGASSSPGQWVYSGGDWIYRAAVQIPSRPQPQILPRRRAQRQPPPPSLQAQMQPQTIPAQTQPRAVTPQPNYRYYNGGGFTNPMQGIQYPPAVCRTG